MKKFFRGAAALALAALVIGLLVGCAPNHLETVAQEDIPSMFVELEQSGNWRIVAHRETGVMYAVSNASHSFGIFTLLVNPDGSPMIWEPEG